MKMKQLAIFASGSGTNAENIIRHFKENGKAEVVAIFCNNPKAEIIGRAKNLGVDCIVFDKKDFYESGKVEKQLEELKVDLIVLAGFLLLLPEKLIKHFPKKIINIHPALLPKFGGKGFYGSKVHEAVLKAGEKKSGITIHYVDEKFDEGEIIFQTTCDVDESETAETLAKKIRQLEHEYYPRVIESILNGMHNS
jgi:phosphoribosylglycinamide formyltransferase-1